MDQDPTLSPKDTGQEGARAPLFPSLRKEDGGLRGSRLLSVVRIAVPSVPPILLLPLLLSPPDPDSSCHLLKQDRRMPRFLCLLLGGKGDEGPRGVRLLCGVVVVVVVVVVVPIFLFSSYFPCYPHPLPPLRCVYC